MGCPNLFCSLHCSAKYKISLKDKEVWRKHLSDCGKIGGKAHAGIPRNISQKLKDFFKNRWIGDKNPNWRGGVATIKPYKHYANEEYKNWRKSVFERDGYTCRICGKNHCFLHPHHIKSYTNFPELRYIMDNGLTLCVPCHKIEHSGHKHSNIKTTNSL
jgi:5-methylcytosine-specific restriction endonuclease McrA